MPLGCSADEQASRVGPGPLHVSRFRDFSLQTVLEPQVGAEGQEGAGWSGVWRLSDWPDERGPTRALTG